MFNLFTKEKETKNDESHLSLISIAALLVHSAKIDQNFTEKEKNIIKNALIEMGAAEDTLDEIIKDAEIKEKDANQNVTYPYYVVRPISYEFSLCTRSLLIFVIVSQIFYMTSHSSKVVVQKRYVSPYHICVLG